ncbi:hypothetical protein GCM10009654_18890 [Streptomyces hebeiensis]|uniref:HTH tetR-type domain-containing protein n=1 Tax=Streptomyces hebeiensis TaxID=229486 RepID=A0ABN1USF5_9ACTN
MSEGFKRRTPSRLGEGAALKEEILRAAARLLTETGREQDLSLRAVAREVGIAAPSIYLHFKDRAELVEELTRRAFGRLVAELRAAWEEEEEAAGPRAALGAMAHRYCRFAWDNPKIYRLMFGIERIEGSRDQAASHPLWTVHQLWVEKVAVCRADRSGHEEDERLAKLLWSALHGLVGLAMAVPFPADQRNLAQLVDDYLDLML